MERLPSDAMLEFNSYTLNSVRKIYQLDEPGKMEDAVNNLDKWVKQQRHFRKKHYKKHYLEMTIISSKGSLERAKARLEKVCTFRTKMAQIFGDYSVKEIFKDYHGIVTFAILPQLTEDNQRILFVRNSGQKFEPGLVFQFLRLCVVWFEYIMAHDYSDGIITIVDLSDVSILELMKKISLSELRQIAALVEAYGMRLLGFHLISQSRFINLIIWVFKQILSAKLSKRVHVHQKLDTLYNFVPKDILPKEYGGEEGSLETLHDKWAEIYESDEFRKFLVDMSEYCIDESLRQNDDLNKH